jgi:flavin reductase (DIM6/NTAB) family NADH-FMN oxidoreductase RutF
MNLEFESRRFRAALRRFATGVTIVTTRGAAGTPIGMTANSFNSVSLDPPLVLWSLNKTSRNRAVFEQAGHYAINVLCREQADLAARFAAPLADRFAGIPWREGRSGMPLFEGCLAWFECCDGFRYEGGDHVIFVGEVVHFDHCDDRVPLLFHGGAYGEPLLRAGP